MVCSADGTRRRGSSRGPAGFDRPSIGAGQTDVLVGDTPDDFEHNAGLTGIEPVVVLHPRRATAGDEEDRVTGFDVALLRIPALTRSTNIGDHDLTTRPIILLDSGEINKIAAGN